MQTLDSKESYFFLCILAFDSTHLLFIENWVGIFTQIKRYKF